jgi:hypothetical protein
MEGQNTDQQKKLSLDEAAQDYEDGRTAAKANSRFASIDPGTAEEYTFNGVVYKRHTSGTDTKTGAAFEAEKYDFELNEATSDGTARVLSFGAGNKIVPELIRLLKSGQRTFTISRTGEGTNTRYQILTVKKKATATAAPAAAPAAAQ